jgi:hypothetical protein
MTAVAGRTDAAAAAQAARAARAAHSSAAAAAVAAAVNGSAAADGRVPGEDDVVERDVGWGRAAGRIVSHEQAAPKPRAAASGASAAGAARGDGIFNRHIFDRHVARIDEETPEGASAVQDRATLAIDASAVDGQRVETIAEMSALSVKVAPLASAMT